MAEAPVVQQLDGPFAAPLPAVLDEEAEHGAELLPTEWILATDLRQLDDHQLGVGRNGEPGLSCDGLRLLAHDVRIDTLPRWRNHQAFERALFVRRTEVGALSSKRVAHLSLDRRIADDGVFRRTEDSGIECLSI